MRKRLLPAFLAITMSLASAAAFAQPAQKAGGTVEVKKAPEPLKIKVGDVAPDFTLLAYDGQGVKAVSLHDYRGKKNVMLAFFVFAFTGG